MSLTSRSTQTRAVHRRQLLLAGAGAALLVLAGCATGNGASGAGHFALRGASTVASPGWSKIANPLPAGGDLYLAPGNVLDASDVVRANAQKDAIGRAVLVLQFSPAGTARLAAASRELQGRQLAALVDGRVVSLYPVQGVMSINTLAVTGLSSYDEAVRLVQQLSPQR